MTDPGTPKSELVLYQSEDGRTRIQCRFEDQLLWLTQAQLAELYQTSVPNISLHLEAIFEERELVEAATVKSHSRVRQPRAVRDALVPKLPSRELEIGSAEQWMGGPV